MKNIFIPFLILCFIACSCEKENVSSNNNDPQTPPDYSGIYDCERSDSWFNINDPNGNGDTTYQATLEVFQSGDIITINGFTFHCDSVANENLYTEHEGGTTSRHLRFYSQDSIYFSSHSGGLGGGGGSSYIGKKM